MGDEFHCYLNMMKTNHVSSRPDIWQLFCVLGKKSHRKPRWWAGLVHNLQDENIICKKTSNNRIDRKKNLHGIIKLYLTDINHRMGDSTSNLFCSCRISFSIIWGVLAYEIPEQNRSTILSGQMQIKNNGYECSAYTSRRGQRMQDAAKVNMIYFNQMVAILSSTCKCPTCTQSRRWIFYEAGNPRSSYYNIITFSPSYNLNPETSNSVTWVIQARVKNRLQK